MAVNPGYPEILWIVASDGYALSSAGQAVGDGFGVGDTFLFKHAVGQQFRSVAGQDGTSALEENWAVVVLIIRVMHGAAGGSFAGVNYRLVDLQAVHAATAIFRQQGGVDIQDAVFKGRWNAQQR